MALDGKGNGCSVVLATTEQGKNGLCWHPFIWEGSLSQYGIEDFEITASVAEKYIENLQNGIPGAAGIPIDELGDHSVNKDGAFGWGKELARTTHDVNGKLMRAVSAGVEWTELGVSVLAKGLYKYISPRFTTRPVSTRRFGVPYVIKAAALCTRPLFWWQPEVEFVAAEIVDWDELREAREARSRKYHIEVRGDGRLIPLKAYREDAPDPEDYADPVNLKYPLKPSEKLALAPIFFSQAYKHYLDAQSRRVVYARIVRAEKREGMRHLPNPKFDKLLPPDLRSWVGGA
jgi:hypothetical protein